MRWDHVGGGYTARTVVTGTRVDQRDLLALDRAQYAERSPINRSPLAYREVTAVRDGMPEGQPFMPPKTVHAPIDYAGNYVIARIAPDVYALYAHLQSDKIAVKVGDKVKAGARIGRVGNSGNSSAPHLHFGLLDRPDPLTGNSLPFVIDQFELTGKVDVSEERRTLAVKPASGKIEAAYPLVRGVTTFR